MDQQQLRGSRVSGPAHLPAFLVAGDGLPRRVRSVARPRHRLRGWGARGSRAVAIHVTHRLGAVVGGPHADRRRACESSSRSSGRRLRFVGGLLVFAVLAADLDRRVDGALRYAAHPRDAAQRRRGIPGHRRVVTLLRALDPPLCRDPRPGLKAARAWYPCRVSTLPDNPPHLPSARRRWRDYLELTKPKVSLLIVFTAIVGMVLASPGMVPLPPLIFGTLGIALASGSAAAFNHVLDRRIDEQMARTRSRPLPTGHLATSPAIAVRERPRPRVHAGAVAHGGSAHGRPHAASR